MTPMFTFKNVNLEPLCLSLNIHGLHKPARRHRPSHAKTHVSTVRIVGTIDTRIFEFCNHHQNAEKEPSLQK